MNHTTPPARPQVPSVLVERAIRRGEKFTCTCGRDCVNASVAWCPKCNAPRCSDHIYIPHERRCAECGTNTISFDSIRKGVRP